MTAPRRVRVVGSSGAGKSTLAGPLARRLGVPLLEVDAILYRPGWRTVGAAEYEAALDAFRTGPGSAGWVVDGGYPTVADGLADTADTVVWLDLPRGVVMARLVRRTLARLLLRRRLVHGDRERWRRVLSREPLGHPLLWTWTQHAAERQRWAAIAAASPATWVRLRSGREAGRWLAGLRDC